MKYLVHVPPSKTKRMNSNIAVLVQSYSGWFSHPTVHFPAQPDDIIEIEVDDCFEWNENTSWLDGFVFNVEAVYTNSTGSREERQRLVPIKNGV